VFLFATGVLLSKAVIYVRIISLDDLLQLNYTDLSFAMPLGLVRIQ
jgi:hypothetical protein